MKALVVVDFQNDFIEGTLSVPGAKEIINDVKNKILEYSLRDDFIIIFTKDFHPNEHISFNIWPKHCVKDTWGSEIHEDIIIPDNSLIFHKGESMNVDSYGAFYDLDKRDNGFDAILKSKNVDELYIIGLAYDYCVAETALQSAEYSYKTTIIKSLTRTIEEENTKSLEVKFKNEGIIVKNE